MRSAERAKEGGYELLDAGSGGDSTLLPLAKAERLLGVASRMMIFMLCLEGGEADMRRHTTSATHGADKRCTWQGFR